MMDEDLSFYSMSTPQSSETSRFSLWGMPLDAPAPTTNDMSRGNIGICISISIYRARVYV